jgi:cell division septation protein DedD
MRKASRIYKRKSRSNLETFIILIGAIIILGVAFHLARDRGYIPPENQITIAEKEEAPVREVPVESPSKITVEKIQENTESAEIEIKKEATPEVNAPLTEPNIVNTPKVEPEAEVIQESEISSEKKVYTVQVGAFSTEKNAQNLAQEIRDKGYQTYVVKGKTLYKVQVGEFKNYQEAQNISQKLKEFGYPFFITSR